MYGKSPHQVFLENLRTFVLLILIFTPTPDSQIVLFIWSRETLCQLCQHQKHLNIDERGHYIDTGTWRWVGDSAIEK